MEYENNQENNVLKSEPEKTPVKKDGVVGPIIGIIIVIALLITGAIFFYGSIIEKRAQDRKRILMSENPEIFNTQADIEEARTE